MSEKLLATNYPLGFPCGRSLWERLDLTQQFRQDSSPPASYFYHLLADDLRSAATADTLSAAELELLATLNRALRIIADHFLRTRDVEIDNGRMTVAQTDIGLPSFDPLLSEFVRSFPAVSVELGDADVAALFAQLVEGEGDLELFHELLLLYIQTQNPALKGAGQTLFFEETELDDRTNYRQLVQQIDLLLPHREDDFLHQPQTLLGRLLEPLRQGMTLAEQLQYVQKVWVNILPPELLAQIITALTHYEREGFQHGPPGEPEMIPLNPAAGYESEYADFTIDHDWMPRTVLLAKSTYVWLAQLSQKYRYPIERLDQIPDVELDELRDYGFTSLWLIGLWKRSQASLKIKQMMGQQQVAASAYAIDDYVVSDDLGGDGALDNLRYRCQQRGIDLACDVVTNHTGIESALLRDHPDWFIQLSHPPYPGYRFIGPDLSEDPTYAIQIEDGYFNHTEAAVVCRYQHRHTGQERFIYHGNDGTHLPWNDTVQLNYLLGDVREAMIRLIIDVARRFRIIRFDAAMTLAKKHFQRLWYPLPGAVDGVPSRSDYAMSHEEFNRYFPVEFWRQLVDRIQEEAPDTLLVAEAFWLMEGYFVRTLGMHRVYNSAFMNMLKTEENGKYRETIKNILAFDPAILQRFVNFMSNPDEEPAVEQFGNGDKYFCVATLLATMPGLPMFGHGQVEGLHEKYGMEYLNPRWDEQPDQKLLERHADEIFPLLRNRALFSGAEQFQLYDFISTYGVEEDIFAYSNHHDGKTVLILCNNSPKSICGRIGSAVPMSDKEGMPVGQACSFDLSGPFVLLSDLATGQQSLQRSEDLLQGGEFTLEPYCHRVLTGFVSLVDDGRWQVLWERCGAATRKNLWLDHAALLLEPSWEIAHALLKTKLTTDSRHLQPLIDQLIACHQVENLHSHGSDAFLEIICHALFPQETLGWDEIVALDSLLSGHLPADEQRLFGFLESVFNQSSFRPLLGCHYYDYIDWFEKEGFYSLCLLVLQYEAALCARFSKEESSQVAIRMMTLIEQLQRVLKLAHKVGYRVDELLHRLDGVIIGEKAIPVDTKRGKRILFVASEATPFAKTGGLADVVGSLPRALRQLGHDVHVVIPYYRVVKQGETVTAKTKRSLEITLQGRAYRGSLKRSVYDGVPYWFIDTPELFDREEIYATASGDYPDNGLRYGFFARAILEMAKLLDFKPDVIHLHDWQTGLIPALLKTDYATQEFYRDTKTELTIHNLGYQGMFPLELLRTLELPTELGSSAALEYYGRLSFLKGAIVFSDTITTVSPTYCHEIQGTEQGLGFDGLLRSRGKDLYGIINGLDQRIWNPQSDRHLPYHYSRENLRNKNLCKTVLQQELQLEEVKDRPLIAVISRLDPQKGIDLLEAIWTPLLERHVQFVLLGSGSQEQMQFWQQQQGRYPGQVSINLTFNEALSHRIYAAADLLLVPSRYEPCGLTQMIALTYGVLPVVRRTGGLADTVVDIDEDPRAGYGFVFDRAEPGELLQSIDRGLQLYANRRRWLTVVKRGMACDFSWKNSAEQYQKLYRQMAK